MTLQVFLGKWFLAGPKWLPLPALGARPANLEVVLLTSSQHLYESDANFALAAGGGSLLLRRM